MLAVAAWALPHAIGFGFETEAQLLLWERLRYPGTVAAPVLYLLFSLQYAGYDRWVSTRTIAGLSAVPLVTIVIVWTGPELGLFWTAIDVDTAFGTSVLAPEYGPWYWINLAYLYAVTATGLTVYASLVLKAGAIYRKQALVMFLAGALPLLANATRMFGFVSSPAVDFTTVGLAATGVLFAVTLFYLDLLQLRPVARERLLEQLEDGVIVIRPCGLVRDHNPIAATLFQDLLSTYL